MHSAQHTVHDTPCATQHSVQCTVHDTVRDTLCTMHSVQHTVHDTPCTTHCAQCTVHDTLCTTHHVQHSVQCTMHSAQHTVHDTPCATHNTVCNAQCATHCARHTMCNTHCTTHRVQQTTRQPYRRRACRRVLGRWDTDIDNSATSPAGSDPGDWQTIDPCTAGTTSVDSGSRGTVTWCPCHRRNVVTTLCSLQLACSRHTAPAAAHTTTDILQTVECIVSIDISCRRTGTTHPSRPTQPFILSRSINE